MEKEQCKRCKWFVMEKGGKCSRWSRVHLVPADRNQAACEWFVLKEGRRAEVDYPDGATGRQKAAIEYLIQKVKDFDFHGEGYEFKKLETDISEYGIVFLQTTVGLIGDEGGMAEVFGRIRRSYHIGPRGGIRAFDGTKIVRGRKAIYTHIS